MQDSQNNRSILGTNFLLIFLLNEFLSASSTTSVTFIDDANGNVATQPLAYNPPPQPNQTLNCNDINISIILEDSAPPSSEATENEHSRRMKRCIAQRLREKSSSNARKSSPKSSDSRNESDVRRVYHDGGSGIERMVAEADEYTAGERDRRDNRPNVVAASFSNASSYKPGVFEIGSHQATDVRVHHDIPASVMEKLGDILEGGDTRSSSAAPFEDAAEGGSGNVRAPTPPVATHPPKIDHLQSLLKEANSVLESLLRPPASYDGAALETKARRRSEQTRNAEQIFNDLGGHPVSSEPVPVHPKIGTNDRLQFEMNGVRKEANADNGTYPAGRPRRLLLPQQSELSTDLNVSPRSDEIHRQQAAEVEVPANTGSSRQRGESSRLSEPSFHHRNGQTENQHRLQPHHNSHSRANTDHHGSRRVSSESYPRASEIPSSESGVSSMMKPDNQVINEPSDASTERSEAPRRSNSSPRTDDRAYSETLHKEPDVSSGNPSYFNDTSERVYYPSALVVENSANHVPFPSEKSTTRDHPHSRASTEQSSRLTTDSVETVSVKPPRLDSQRYAVASENSIQTRRNLNSGAVSTTLRETSKASSETTPPIRSDNAPGIPNHLKVSSSNHPADFRSSRRISSGKLTSHDYRRSDSSAEEGLHRFIPEGSETPSSAKKPKHHAASGKSSSHAERKPSAEAASPTTYFPGEKSDETSAEPNRRGSQRVAVASNYLSEIDAKPTEAIYLPREKFDASSESSGNSNYSDFRSPNGSTVKLSSHTQMREVASEKFSRPEVTSHERLDASSVNSDRFQVASEKMVTHETPSKLPSKKLNNEKSFEASLRNFGHTRESSRKEDLSYENLISPSNILNQPTEISSGNSTYPDTRSSPDSSGKLINSEYPHFESSSAEFSHLSRNDLEETHSDRHQIHNDLETPMESPGYPRPSNSKKTASESSSRSNTVPLGYSLSDSSNKMNASSEELPADSDGTEEASRTEIRWDSGYVPDQFHQSVLVSSSSSSSETANSSDQIGSSPSPNEDIGNSDQHPNRVPPPKRYSHQKVKFLSENFANFRDASDDAKRKLDKAPLRLNAHLKTTTIISPDTGTSSAKSDRAEVHNQTIGGNVSSAEANLEKQPKYNRSDDTPSWVRNDEPTDLNYLRSAAKAKEHVSHAGNEREQVLEDARGDFYEGFLRMLNEMDKKRMEPLIHLLRGSQNAHHSKLVENSHKSKAEPDVDSEHDRNYQLKPLEDASASVGLLLSSQPPPPPPLKSNALDRRVFDSWRNETSNAESANSNSTPANKTDHKVTAAVTIDLVAEDAAASSHNHDKLSVEEVRPVARDMPGTGQEEEDDNDDDEFPIDVPRKLDYLLENKDATLELKTSPLRTNLTGTSSAAAAKHEECNKIYIITDKSNDDILSLLKLAATNSNERNDSENPIVSARRSSTSSPFNINDMIECVNVKTGSNNFASTDNGKVRESVVQLLDMLKKRRTQEYELSGREEAGGKKHEIIMQINEYIELLELLVVYLSRDPYELLDEHNDARQSNNESPFPYEDPHRRFIEDQFYYVNPEILNDFIDVYKKYSTRDSFPAYKKSHRGRSSRRRTKGRLIGGSMNRLLRLQSLIPPMLHDLMDDEMYRSVGN